MPLGSVFGKRDLLVTVHVLKCDVKCGTCLHKFDCRETTLSNAENRFKIYNGKADQNVCIQKLKNNTINVNFVKVDI